MKGISVLIGLVTGMSVLGCSNEFRSERVPLGWNWTTVSQEFALSLPDTARHQFKRSNGSFTFSTSSGTSFDLGSADYYITLDQSVSRIECSRYRLGVSRVKHLSNTSGATVWGRVDYWDTYPGESTTPRPTCRPPRIYYSRPNNVSDHIETVTLQNGQGTYALCSTKSDKAILICVSQVTDDPDLARQIFESFRWLK